MNRKTVAIVLGSLGLLLASLGWWYWQRGPAPAADPAPVAAPGPVASKPGEPVFTAIAHDNGFGELVPVLLAPDKAELTKRYQNPYIKEFYDGKLEDTVDPVDEDKHTAPLPAFDYQQALTGKSYLDLLLLRNEVYARNGYCFLNPTARYHFARQKWYRPVWEEDEYNDKGEVVRPAAAIPVPLTQQEMDFVQRVHAREVQLLAQREQPQGGHPMVGLDFLTNQRDGDVAPAFAAAPARSALLRHNFVLVPTHEEQLFYLYDQNQYSYTPNFITTDLVLQLLHKYLNGILSDVEEQRLGPVVGSMLAQAGAQAQLLARQCQQPPAREAATWAATYYAIGQGLLQKTTPPAGTDDAATAREVASCTAATATGSAFLGDSMFDYTAFKPRGMYTRNDTTRRYFRAVKWLNSAPVFLDSDAGMLRALALAQSLAASPQAARQFATFTQVVSMLAGDEDNRSLTHLLQLLKQRYAGQTLDQLAAPATLAQLRQALVAAGTDRIRPKGITSEAQTALDQPKLLFTAGRYSFDGEILSRLTNLKQPRPGQYVRPFPKGLDVFASFGNRTAQEALLSHYREAARWPAYPDTLRALQQQFGRYTDWNRNLYTKTMQMLLALNAPGPAADSLPPFARTPAWQRRNLSTALGGWTELKHDLLLYTEQPMGAEAGGPTWGPPPPRHQSFVEPNLPFWDGALALLVQQERALNQLKVNTGHLSGLNHEIQDLVTNLRNMARKQLRRQPLTVAEQQRLSYVGGEVENLTIKILKTVQLPDRERHLGLVADVYALNRDVLEEAVGTADALYAAVEINGTWVLARGAVFSYYEFVSPERLTDEEWRVKLRQQPPPRPSWLQDLIVPVRALDTHEDGPHYLR